MHSEATGYWAHMQTIQLEVAPKLANVALSSF